MLKTALAMLAGLAAMSGGESAAAAQGVPVAWTIAPTGSRGAQTIQLSLSRRSGRNHTQISRSVAAADLPGLTAAQLASASDTPARFRIARDAGTLDCRGKVRRMRGGGECAFQLNAAFAQAMRQRGIAVPTPDQQFMLAMHDVDLALIAALHRSGYRNLDIAQLTSAAIHGVTPEYLAALDAAGHRAGSIDRLVQMRIHRIDADYVRELAAAGPAYRNIPTDQLVSMRIHRVAAADVRAFAQAGYANLTPAQLVTLSIHRVTPAYVRDMAAAGYRRLTPEQLVNLHIHGVDANEARRANAALRRN